MAQTCIQAGATSGYRLICHHKQKTEASSINAAVRRVVERLTNDEAEWIRWERKGARKQPRKPISRVPLTSRRGLRSRSSLEYWKGSRYSQESGISPYARISMPTARLRERVWKDIRWGKFSPSLRGTLYPHNEIEDLISFLKSIHGSFWKTFMYLRKYSWS